LRRLAGRHADTPPMTTERAPDSAFPTTLEHKHGLTDWSPMLPERSAETIEPGRAPTERIYRCQKIGCTEVVRIGAGELSQAEAEPAV
jgi:hypothetical protein